MQCKYIEHYNIYLYWYFKKLFILVDINVIVVGSATRLKNDVLLLLKLNSINHDKTKYLHGATQEYSR